MPPEAPDLAAHYALARQGLDLDPQADAQAAAELASLLLQRAQGPITSLTHLERLFSSRPVIVMAPGPQAVDQVRQARQRHPASPLIVAGSAVERAHDHELHPWLIVSDLDGSASAHRALSRRGSLTAVHAHGDNRDLLEQLVPELEGPLVGTCQVDPSGGSSGGSQGGRQARDGAPVHRVPGFTDGDRACWMAQQAGAREIWLAGWDLEAEVEDERKRVKLGIAKELVGELEAPVRDLGSPRGR